jgi:hypothetical protein
MYFRRHQRNEIEKATNICFLYGPGKVLNTRKKLRHVGQELNHPASELQYRRVYRSASSIFYSDRKDMSSLFRICLPFHALYKVSIFQRTTTRSISVAEKENRNWLFNFLFSFLPSATRTTLFIEVFKTSEKWYSFFYRPKDGMWL